MNALKDVATNGLNFSLDPTSGIVNALTGKFSYARFGTASISLSNDLMIYTTGTASNAMYSSNSLTIMNSQPYTVSNANFIVANCNVGIGTTVPTSKLHINEATNSYVNFRMTASNSTLKSDIGITNATNDIITGATKGDLCFKNTSYCNMRFSTNNSSIAMSIDTFGNIICSSNMTSLTGSMSNLSASNITTSNLSASNATVITATLSNCSMSNATAKNATITVGNVGGISMNSGIVSMQGFGSSSDYTSSIFAY
jgi:hypothetical protein